MLTMEEQLINIMQTGSVPSIIGCLILYLIIAYQRKETGQKRDQNANMVDYRLTQLENANGNLNEAIKELQDSIINLTISVNKLMIKMEEK